MCYVIRYAMVTVLNHSSPLPPFLCSFLPFFQALKSLVDYDEDSDEEEKSEEQIESPAKRKKMDDS